VLSIFGVVASSGASYNYDDALSHHTCRKPHAASSIHSPIADDIGIFCCLVWYVLCPSACKDLEDGQAHQHHDPQILAEEHVVDDALGGNI
jgi:hypothetical protein